VAEVAIVRDAGCVARSCLVQNAYQHRVNHEKRANAPCSARDYVGLAAHSKRTLRRVFGALSVGEDWK
jgi:hypothetical protein